MITWPKLVNLKTLRGFLRLTDYCKNFIKHYGILSKLFTYLLKKNTNQWNLEPESLRNFFFFLFEKKDIFYILDGL